MPAMDERTDASEKGAGPAEVAPQPEEPEVEFSRGRRQGIAAIAVGLVLEIVGAILSATHWVILLGEGVEERPFYLGGIGDFLVIFGLVCLVAGGGLFLYYDEKLKQGADSANGAQ